MGRVMATRVRRCVVCLEKGPNNTVVVHERRFLLPGEPVPRCAIHGPMRPQANNRYLGKAV